MTELISALVLLLLFCLVSAQNECYAAANKRVGSSVVPCGRLNGDSHSACCYSGDLCLSDSACWDPGSNVTYLYGCTDSTYEDSVCPYKCGAAFDEYWWVGLLHCGESADNQWACNHATEVTQEIIEVPPEECDSDNALAFAGPAVLQPILSLPTDVGGNTEYFSRVNPTSYSLDPNYTPSALTVETTASVPTTVEHISVTVSATPTSSAASSTTGSASDSTSDSVSSTPSTTSPSSASSTATPSTGLSTDAKAGIGAGVGAAAVIAIIALGFFCVRRRRRRGAHSQAVPPMGEASATKYTYNSTPPTTLPRYEQPSELPGSQVSPSEGQRQPLLGVGAGGVGAGGGAAASNRWSNSETVSSWSSPGLGTTNTNRSSLSPIPGRTELGGVRERDGVHELGN